MTNTDRHCSNSHFGVGPTVRSLYNRPINVSELLKYWKAVETSNDAIEILPLSYMPPWSDICSKLDSEIHLIEGGYFSSKNHGYCGVYRLISLEFEDNLTKPAILNRICGQDTTGTLYIGCATSLSYRLNQLRRSLLSNEDSHSAVRMLNRIPLLDLPRKRLAVALRSTARYPEFVEKCLIEAYINSYGDPPTLNYKI
jgi:hypothetical protein